MDQIFSKGCFWSKTGKVNIAMEFNIFKLICNIFHKLLKQSKFLEKFLEILTWFVHFAEINQVPFPYSSFQDIGRVATPKLEWRNFLGYLQATLIMEGLVSEFIWGIASKKYNNNKKIKVGFKKSDILYLIPAILNVCYVKY